MRIILTMLAKSNAYNINFGWSAKTHKAITQAAADKINKASTHKDGKPIFDARQLTEASILPDKEPHSVNAHAADITKLRSDDALASFNQYDANVRVLIKSKNKEGLSENIGRALHYLQDMQNPMHVNSTVAPCAAEMALHKEFETHAVSIQNETIKYAKGIQVDKPVEFGEFLTVKMKEAKVMANYITRNLPTINKLLPTEQQGLINSYQVTYKYLTTLAKLMK